MAAEKLEMQSIYGVQVRQGKLWGLAGAINASDIAVTGG
jgi:hypothetical protein